MAPDYERPEYTQVVTAVTIAFAINC